tara:strand:- start:34418 stop:35266 length:849 start_codon:yes stop_codon:yes gene_type:complete
METWKIGNVTITRVVDVLQDINLTMLIPEATPDNLEPMSGWLKPHFINEDGTIPLSIHTFLVESEGVKILVDTCIGNNKPRPLPDWNLRQGQFLEQLEEAGAKRESVDVVLCTHLHVDHVGWNTVLENDRWVPTFANARYLIGKKEWEYWKNEDDPFGAEAKQDSILPVIESGLVDFVDSSHEITSEVSLIPTPGHTPGHVSVKIESEGQRAVITGDLFHHPVQFSRPKWKDIADVQSEIAEVSREAFMDQYSENTLVLGTHFAAPTAGRIVKDGGVYRFQV